MSYDIVVDLLGTSATSCPSNNFTTSTGRGKALFPTWRSMIALMQRAIYFRRLKLLKFYIITFLVLVTLFLLLKSHSSTHTEKSSSDAKHLNDKADSYFEENHASNLEADSAVIRNEQLDHVRLEIYSELLHESKFPDNLTKSLSLLDFGRAKTNVMQVRIRDALKHSWDNYRKYAWGYDMLKPRSKKPDHWFNLGLTIVDSVDSLMIMGLSRDTKLAVDWIENELKFDSSNENSNCFEMTIRILAGILSAYHLTGRDKLKQQAITMGDILLKCYNTESQIVPYSDIDLKSHRAHPPQWNPYSSLSEVASLQLEFRYLSQISGNSTYETTTFRTSEHLHNLSESRSHKLLPMYINPNTGQLGDSIITIGARSDSYYEYLLKQYLQTGIKWLESDYLDTVDEIQSNLMRYTNGSSNFTYVAEMQIFKTLEEIEDRKYYNKMDHLVCFLPGTLVLGYYHFSPQASEFRIKYNLETPSYKLNSRYDSHLAMAKALARTCFYMYNNMGTGLSPEIATFVHATENDLRMDEELKRKPQDEIQVQSTEAHNILRPEYVESLFYLYHITGLPIYRVQANQIFDAFQKYSKIPTGYSAISDVREKPPPDADLDELLHKNAPDRMESFWLSETLKYLYLTFCDDSHIVGTLLNSYIFNTEGHMIPII